MTASQNAARSTESAVSAPASAMLSAAAAASSKGSDTPPPITGTVPSRSPARCIDSLRLVAAASVRSAGSVRSDRLLYKVIARKRHTATQTTYAMSVRIWAVRLSDDAA